MEAFSFFKYIIITRVLGKCSTSSFFPKCQVIIEFKVFDILI